MVVVKADLPRALEILEVGFPGVVGRVETNVSTKVDWRGIIHEEQIVARKKTYSRLVSCISFIASRSSVPVFLLFCSSLETTEDMVERESTPKNCINFGHRYVEVESGLP